MNNQAIIKARQHGFLICRYEWHLIEKAWREECDAKRVPIMVVNLYQGQGSFYIDPITDMHPRAVDLLWPLFETVAIRLAKRRNKAMTWACTSHYCGITLLKSEAFTLAHQSALIVRNFPDICPEHIPKKQEAL